MARKIVPQSEIERLIYKYFSDDYEVALAVAKAESNLVPTAANWADSHATCKGSFGVFQVGCVHGSTVENLFDPEYNIRKAREIYVAAGHSWRPWGAHSNGSFRKYLAQI